MSELILEPNIEDPDGFYAELLALHEGRSESDSAAVNARLVLILANHVGCRDILSQAFDLAAKSDASAKPTMTSKEQER